MTTVNKASTAIKANKIRLASLAILILVLATSLTTSNSRFEPLTGWPSHNAEWVIPKVTDNHLGELIEATIKIVTQPAVIVDEDTLPREGESIGPFEVRQRDIRIYYPGSVRVTEVHYVLQYLLPLDNTVFSRRGLPRINYSLVFPQVGLKKIRWKRINRQVQKENLFIVKRVQPGDKPFPLAGKFPPKLRFGWAFKAVGTAIVFGVPAFLLIRLIRTRLLALKARRIEREKQRRLKRHPFERFLELRELWLEEEDYAAFVEACVLARARRKEQLGLRKGQLLPDEFRWCSSEPIYSWRQLTREEVEEVFNLLEEAFANEE